MKVVINPKYSHLESFIRTVLDHNYKVDAVYRQFRNRVEDVTIDGVRMVIKIFKKPTELNRVVYSFIRKTKARRSYEKSFKMLEAGMLVPEPIAYMEKRKGIFFHTGCYISAYLPYRAIDDYEHYYPADYASYQEFLVLLKEIAEFAVQMHLKGIIHNDFNKDNILYRRLESNDNATSGENNGESQRRHYDFALIDLNRVKFNCHSLSMAAKDLSNIHLGHVVNQKIVQDYCEIRSLNKYEFARLVLIHSTKYVRHARLKDVVLGSIGLRKHRNKTGYIEESL